MKKVCLFLSLLVFTLPLFAISFGFSGNITAGAEANFMTNNETYFSAVVMGEVEPVKIKINNMITLNVPLYAEFVSASFNTHSSRFLQPRIRLSGGLSAKEKFGMFSLEIGFFFGIENYPRLRASCTFVAIRLLFEFFSKNGFSFGIPIKVMYNENYYTAQLGFSIKFGYMTGGKN